MTHDHPDSERVPRWILSLVKAIFLMGLGYVANQFWLIPVQQAHQDDAIHTLIERQDKTDTALVGISEQYTLMLRELSDNKRQLRELSEAVDEHERRQRARAKRELQ